MRCNSNIISLALLLFCGFSVSATANNPWQSIVHNLLAEGIQSHEVDWMTVNQLCIGVLGEPSRYNECRMQKAVCQVRHTQDRQVYKRFTGKPTASIIKRTNIVFHEPEFKTQLQRHHYYRALHERQQRRDRFRNQKKSLEECMQNRGWQDSKRWR